MRKTSRKRKTPVKYVLFSIFAVVFSVVAGIMTNDLIVGGITLASGLLCGYLASEGRRFNYIFGFINYLFAALAAFRNGYFGTAIFYLVPSAPLQIHGFITWKKNLQKSGDVVVRGFTPKNSVIIVSACLVGSFILGYFLSLIPGQQLSFMDAASNCINLCAIILMTLRFKEAWWLWLINNVIDLGLWIFATMSGGENAVMMLLTSIGFLTINIYGIIRWSVEAKKKRRGRKK